MRTARSSARALFSVSSYSSAGRESATTPAPACTYARPPRATTVRMAMAVSIDRPPVRVSQPARYQPLMVTSIGRSGSTWFQHLLSQHPAVAAFRAHSYEATPARELLLLAANSSASGPYTEAFFARKGFRSLLTGADAGDALEGMTAAVGEGVREQAEAAVRGIDRFYDLADRMDGRPPAAEGETHYFTEKNLQPEWLFWEVYPRAREIFLVRDFRDVICSSLAANATRRGCSSIWRSPTSAQRPISSSRSTTALWASTATSAWKSRRTWRWTPRRRSPMRCACGAPSVGRT